jgi:hypothetical protein
MIVSAAALAAAVATSSGGATAAPVPPATDSLTFAFVNVNVVPMDGDRVIEGQTVLVRGGRIVEMGAAEAVSAPSGAVAIDGRGKYLMPGLAEMHAHIPGETAPAQLISDVMYLYVANGVTTIRGMLGAPNQLTLREAAASGAIVSPTIFVGAPSLNGQSAPTPDSAARLVAIHKAAGYDFLKLHPGLRRDVYDGIVTAARAAGITFAGHVSSGVGLARTLEARQSTIDHVDGYLEASVSPVMHERMASGPVPFPEMVAAVEADRLRAWAGRTRDAGTWNVPTMALWETFYSPEAPETFASRPEMKYAAPAMVEAWSRQKQNMARNQLNQGVTTESAARYLELRRLALRALADSGAAAAHGNGLPADVQRSGILRAQRDRAAARHRADPVSDSREWNAERRAVCARGSEAGWRFRDSGRR